MLLPRFHSAAGTHRTANWARKPLRRGIESLGANGEARCGLNSASPAGVVSRLVCMNRGIPRPPPGCDTEGRMAYWRLFYHVVWATHERLALIDTPVEQLIRSVLHSKAKELGIFIHEIGMVEDHVHVVVTIPPTLSIAEVVSQLKGSSSHAVNHLSGHSGARFAWQRSYGVLTIGERSLPSVTGYVRRQKEHHARGTTNDVLERIAAPMPTARGRF